MLRNTSLSENSYLVMALALKRLSWFFPSKLSLIFSNWTGIPKNKQLKCS